MRALLLILTTLCTLVLFAGFYVNESFGAPLLENEWGDFVWYDLNENGLQDPGEPGIPDITVDFVYEQSGGNLVDIASTTTDANGIYLFSNYSFNANVLYYLIFTLPSSDWSFSDPNIGADDTLDSDAKPFSALEGITDRLLVGIGSTDLSYDAGMYENNGTNPVPEPATILLLGFGLAGLAGLGRKKAV
jgi:hypothetical protein